MCESVSVVMLNSEHETADSTEMTDSGSSSIEVNIASTSSWHNGDNNQAQWVR